MRYFLFILVPLLSSNVILSQLNIDSVILDIRKKYKYINKNKYNYKTENESYDWERENIATDSEHENNEHGNYVGTLLKYSNSKGEIMLTIVEDQTSIYQEQSEKTSHREFYFWNDTLFFYFEQKYVISNEIPEGKTTETRIYLHKEEIIRYLTKSAQKEDELKNIKNEAKDINSLTEDDYDILSSNIFLPDW